MPPGHFYSPIPSWPEIERDKDRLFPEPPPRTLAGLDLRETAQMELLAQCIPFYAEMPFTPEKAPGLRYCFDNGAFSYADAIFLYLMLRQLRPRRVIEVGSGHSSCAMLDTNQHFLGNAVETTFIEPYPELLHSLLQSGDKALITIVPERLQDVPLATFDALGENDILFIDSTHVGKIGSDVATIFNDILPALRPGVVVHFHDIFYPFEYPRYWFDEGRPGTKPTCSAPSCSSIQPSASSFGTTSCSASTNPFSPTHAALPAQHRREPLAPAGVVYGLRAGISAASGPARRATRRPPG